jgi:hypothetical protein
VPLIAAGNNPFDGCPMPNLADVKPIGLEGAYMARLLTGAGIARHPDDKLASRVIVLSLAALADYENARGTVRYPIGTAY